MPSGAVKDGAAEARLSGIANKIAGTDPVTR